MPHKKRSLLEQTGPFSSWKEAGERMEQMVDEWLVTQADESSQVFGTLNLSANLARFLIRLNKSADFEKSRRR